MAQLDESAADLGRMAGECPRGTGLARLGRLAQDIRKGEPCLTESKSPGRKSRGGHRI